MHTPDDMPAAVVETSGDMVGGSDEPSSITVTTAEAQPSRAGVKWWLILAIVVADQVTKAMVRNVVSVYESKTLVPGLVDLAHVRNEGVAFGLFNSLDVPFKWVFTTALALTALAGITYYARQIRPNEKLARLGLSMILGGALGNLTDRVWAGYVLDFVDVYWRGWHFWAFNVADACISIGAVLVFIDLLLVKPHASDSV